MEEGAGQRGEERKVLKEGSKERCERKKEGDREIIDGSKGKYVKKMEKEGKKKLRGTEKKMKNKEG